MSATAGSEFYTLSLHDALPICPVRPDQEGSGRVSVGRKVNCGNCRSIRSNSSRYRSEEHTSELQSLRHLVCRLLLEKKTTAGAAAHLACRSERGRARGQRFRVR